MWDRQFDQATWNGTPFNILKTDDEQGKRVDAKELPRSDHHYHEVLGDKIPSYTVEAVFVGADSLSQANAFRSELRKNPEGTLEHPYLGELELVYQTSSQSITTRKGLVKLVIKFIAQGEPVELPKSFSKSLSNYTAPVVDQGNIQFEKQVKAASVDETATIQSEFDGFLDDLAYIANQLKLQDSGVDLQKKIHSAKRSISTITNNPGAFSQQVSGVMSTLVIGAQPSLSRTETSGAPSNVSSIEKVIEKRLSDNENQRSTPIIKLHSTTARLNLNRELAAVSDSTDTDDLTQKLGGANLDYAYQSITNVKLAIEDRYRESTASADYDSLPLVDAIQALKNQVQSQLIKLDEYQQSLKTISVYSKTPSLCLAFSNDCALTEFEGLNAITHPLFMHGDIKVKK